VGDYFLLCHPGKTTSEGSPTRRCGTTGHFTVSKKELNQNLVDILKVYVFEKQNSSKIECCYPRKKEINQRQMFFNIPFNPLVRPDL